MADAEWTPLLASADVSKQPQRVEVGEVGLVVWRARHGRPVVFLDCCPHREVRLSTGRRTWSGHLACDLHGWEFDAEGACVHLPGRPLSDVRGRHATVIECREDAGRLWARLPPGHFSD